MLLSLSQEEVRGKLRTHGLGFALERVMEYELTSKLDLLVESLSTENGRLFIVIESHCKLDKVCVFKKAANRTVLTL